jgi:ATP-dependent Clp protease adaptor protein ClpS
MAQFPEAPEAETAKPKLKEPGRFAVLLHNDDFTTMEFVILVLQKFFKKNHDEAYAITMKVHHEGRGVAGIFSSEIAETKAAQVNDFAKESRFPLKASTEAV